jgi:hypothetical protein
MRLPHLSPTAKAQAWGMLVGGALAVLITYRTGLSWGVFLVGWAGSWVLGEFLFGARLIGRADLKAIALGVVSGLAFPMIGLLAATLTEMARP